MIDKFCQDELHEGDYALPLSEFYAHPTHADGHSSSCKTCDKRKANEREIRVRDENEANGLPRTAHRNRGKDYTQRNCVLCGIFTFNLNDEDTCGRCVRDQRAAEAALRGQEASYQHDASSEQSSPTEERSSLPAVPLNLDRFFRQPTHKLKGWKAV